jgi:hypothetical protein
VADDDGIVQTPPDLVGQQGALTAAVSFDDLARGEELAGKIAGPNTHRIQCCSAVGADVASGQRRERKLTERSGNTIICRLIISRATGSHLLGTALGGWRG